MEGLAGTDGFYPVDFQTKLGNLVILYADFFFKFFFALRMCSSDFIEPGPLKSNREL